MVGLFKKRHLTNVGRIKRKYTLQHKFKDLEEVYPGVYYAVKSLCLNGGFYFMIIYPVLARLY